MMPKKISVDVPSRAEFYDVDSMDIVWHGNYLKFYELGRCALLDKIGYGYDVMKKSGFAWPVVKVDIKYIKPLVFGQEFIIRTTLVDYENRLKLSYRILDKESGTLLNKGSTCQMAVNMETMESLLVSPEALIERVQDYQEDHL